MKRDIEDKIKIEIDDYVFKGIILEDSFNDKKLYNKDISIKFSSTDTYIILNFDKKNYKIEAKNMRFTFIDKEKNKVIIFYQLEGQKESKNTTKEKNKENNNINNENNIINDKENNLDDDENNKNDNSSPALLCQFTEKECNYIYEFKKQMMEKYKEIKKKEEKKDNIFNSFLFGIFQ